MSTEIDYGWRFPVTDDELCALTRSHGIERVMQDNSGNWFSLGQKKR